jgi:undecaprenyl-diphosphatase
VTILEAALLGLIQGLSEFLPISSTAHLTLAGHAMGLIRPDATEQWTAFEAVIQLGTLAAVLIYFRSDIMAIIRAFLSENISRTPFREQSATSRTGWYIILGTVPIVLIGMLLKDVIEGPFTKNLIVIGSSLVGLAILLEIAERTAKFKRPIEDLNMGDAVGIGLAQAMALIPGSSRSGTTITAGLFRGLTREAAARFSFLLSIPAIGGSGLLKLVDALKHLDASGAVAMAVATVVAGVSGYWSIAFLLRYLRTRTTRVFVIYRLLLGGGILAAVWFELLTP